MDLGRSRKLVLLGLHPKPAFIALKIVYLRIGQSTVAWLPTRSTLSAIPDPK